MGKKSRSFILFIYRIFVIIFKHKRATVCLSLSISVILSVLPSPKALAQTQARYYLLMPVKRFISFTPEENKLCIIHV